MVFQFSHVFFETVLGHPTPCHVGRNGGQVEPATLGALGRTSRPAVASGGGAELWSCGGPGFFHLKPGLFQPISRKL